MIFGIERGLSGQIALIGDFYFTSDVHYVLVYDINFRTAGLQQNFSLAR